MHQVLGSGGGEPISGSVESLTNELAEVVNATAQLLLSPRYDEAELAELDVRAREIRAAIRKAIVPENEGGEAVEWIAHGPLVSGG